MPTAITHDPVFNTPVSSTNTAVVRWSGTSGSTLQDCGVLIDGSNNITGIASLTATQVDITGQGDLRLQDTTGGQYVAFQAAGTTTTHTLTFPAAQGSSSTVLTNDGAGVLTWAAVSGTTINTNADNRVMTGSGTANTLNGEENLVYNGAILFVSDDTNAAMSIGLTVQQNHYDNEAFCVKSTDIAHGISGAETDSYFTIQKSNPGAGGAMLTGYIEAGDYAGIQLRTYVIDANGTKTANGVGSFNLTAYHGTDGGPLNDSANANIAVFRAGNTHTRFIFDVEGDLYYDGSSNSYDEYSDAELTRALSYTMQAATSKPSTIIHNKWDDFVEYNEQDLIDAGILGGPVIGVDDADRGLVNLMQLQRLHNGAIWQLHSRLSDQAEEITALKGQLTALVGALEE